MYAYILVSLQFVEAHVEQFLPCVMSIHLILPSATPQLSLEHERSSHGPPLLSPTGCINGNGGHELPFSTFFAMLSALTCLRKGRPAVAGHQLDVYFLGAARLKCHIQQRDNYTMHFRLMAS